MKRHLICFCCGSDAGHFEQWWNRDTGWGVCPSCVTRMSKHGADAKELHDMFGDPGIHYQAPEGENHESDSHQPA